MTGLEFLKSQGFREYDRYGMYSVYEMSFTGMVELLERYNADINRRSTIGVEGSRVVERGPDRDTGDQ
jgi:hypothetical protein